MIGDVELSRARQPQVNIIFELPVELIVRRDQRYVLPLEVSQYVSQRLRCDVIGRYYVRQRRVVPLVREYRIDALVRRDRHAVVDAELTDHVAEDTARRADYRDDRGRGSTAVECIDQGRKVPVRQAGAAGGVEDGSHINGAGVGAPGEDGRGEGVVERRRLRRIPNAVLGVEDDELDVDDRRIRDVVFARR